MTPITYKQVLDKEGSLTGLELWQNGQHIAISFSIGGTHKAYYRWEEVRPIIDELSVQAIEKLIEKVKQ